MIRCALAHAGEPTRSLQTRWIIDGWWKLIVPIAGKPEPYELRTDPWETNNLADSSVRRVRKLTGNLDAWWRPKQ